MNNNSTYSIGTPGTAWQAQERELWRERNTIKRLYQEEVVPKILALDKDFTIEQYGALSYDPERYALYCLKSKQWDDSKPTVLITGGVHGYETSGVHGALKFAKLHGEQYAGKVNLVIAPCVSPWGYETINRWNPLAIDPNRSFYADSPSEEAANLMKYVATLSSDMLLHIDLHETTDTDESEFRPALAARDGIDYIPGSIPDGFYTVGDSETPTPEFQKAVIDSVRAVTHIAPADENGEIIGSKVEGDGIIYYPMKTLGLCCRSMTDCRFGTTTEVYPDSANVTDEECNDAQVAAVIGALEYALNH